MSGLEYLTQDHDTTKQVDGCTNTATEKERACMLRTLRVELYWLIQVLLTPRCWGRVGRYSKEWDRQLRVNMMLFKFEPLIPYRAVSQLGTLNVWICNHPYASFSEDKTEYLQVTIVPLPSRRTALMAWKKLQEDIPDAFK